MSGTVKQTGAPMQSCEQGQVVRVPFPYTDRPVRQHRPALVISDGAIGSDSQLAWVLMITSSENRSWPGDVELGDDYATFGLPAPSMIRPSKIATVDVSQIAVIGNLTPEFLEKVLREVRSTIS